MSDTYEYAGYQLTPRKTKSWIVVTNPTDGQWSIAYEGGSPARAFQTYIECRIDTPHALLRKWYNKLSVKRSELV